MTSPASTLPRFLAVLLCIFPSVPVHAQTPHTINYQGRLLQNTADQDAVSGTVDIVFSIWTGPASDDSASQLWTETWLDVAVSNGIFSVLLGANGSPLDPLDFVEDTSLFLELEVDGETLRPRQQLGSAPFAFVDEPENELQSLYLSGDTLNLTGSDDSIDLAPYLDDTDEQDLELAGNTLSLTNDPSPVDLSPYLDNTDQQDLSLAGTSLALTGDATPVDLSGFLDNTDAQTLDLDGDTLTISGSGSSVDLSEAVEFSSLSNRLSAVEEALERRVFVTSQTYAGTSLGGLAGADARCQALADAAGLDGRFRAWLSDSTASAGERIDRVGTFERVDGARIADSWADLTDGTLDLAIDLTETGAAVAGSSEVWTGTQTDGTAAAEHCLDWSLDGSDGVFGGVETGAGWTEVSTASCSLSARLYCFEQVSIGIDDQQLTLVGNSLQLTSDDGTDTIDLSAFFDNTDTDDQVLSLSGNQLQLTSDDGPDVVSLVSFLDNTDNQSLSLQGNSLRLTSDDGTDTIDLSAYLDNTDNQALSLQGNSLQLSSDDGTDSVDLSAYLDNTDAQALSVSGNNLSISGGNTVSLSAFEDNTDSQDLEDVLTRGSNAGNRDITNLDDVDIDKLTIDDDFECDASSADCIRSSHIEQDTILGNDITDRIFILHIDCNGSCANMSMREACDVIENLRGLDFEVELMDVSCVHDIPSTSGNQFVACDDGEEVFGAYECRAFELRTLGDIPCINGDGTDALVTCYQTDIAK